MYDNFVKKPPKCPTKRLCCFKDKIMDYADGRVVEGGRTDKRKQAMSQQDTMAGQKLATNINITFNTETDYR